MFYHNQPGGGLAHKTLAHGLGYFEVRFPSIIISPTVIIGIGSTLYEDLVVAGGNPLNENIITRLVDVTPYQILIDVTDVQLVFDVTPITRLVLTYEEP